MLVLSRKPGDSIQIGEDVKITIVRIGPSQVRIGIEAPRETNIVRTELIAADLPVCQQIPPEPMRAAS